MWIVDFAVEESAIKNGDPSYGDFSGGYGESSWGDFPQRKSRDPGGLSGKPSKLHTYSYY